MKRAPLPSTFYLEPSTICDSVAVLETIALTRQDTLGSILARLQAAQADRILFVVPRKLTLTVADLLMLCARGGGSQAAGGFVDLQCDPAQACRRGGNQRVSQPLVGHADALASVYIHVRRAGRRPPSPGGIEVPFGQGLYSPHSPTGFRPAAFRRSFKRATSPWWIELGLAITLIALAAGMIYVLGHHHPFSDDYRDAVGRAAPGARAAHRDSGCST